MDKKKILLGINTYNLHWLDSIKTINKPNVYIHDFSKKDTRQKILSDKIDYIIPLSDKDYQLVKLCCYGIPILYPAIDTLEMLNRPLHFIDYMLCNFNFLIPKIYYLDGVELSPIVYPVISKRLYGSDNRIYFTGRVMEKYLVQQYVDGIVYGAYLLCIYGRTVNWKVVKNGNVDPGSNNLTFISLFEPIIKKLNYTGGLHIDFRSTDKIYILKINPRFGDSAFTDNFFYDLVNFD